MFSSFSSKQKKSPVPPVDDGGSPRMSFGRNSIGQKSQLSMDSRSDAEATLERGASAPSSLGLFSKAVDRSGWAPVVIFIGPHFSGKKVDFGQTMEHISVDDSPGMYEPVALETALQIWSGTAYENTTKYLRTRSVAGKSLLARLQSDQCLEMQLIVYYFTGRMTMSDFKQHIHRALEEDTDATSVFLEACRKIRSIKTKFRVPDTIYLRVEETIKMVKKDANHRIKRALKYQPYLACYDDGNIPPDQYDIQHVVAYACKYGRKIRVACWGLELRDCSAAELVFKSILHFFRTGRYINCKHVLASYRFAESKKINGLGLRTTGEDFIFETGYSMNSDGSIHRLTTPKQMNRKEIQTSGRFGFSFYRSPTRQAFHPAHYRDNKRNDHTKDPDFFDKMLIEHAQDEHEAEHLKQNAIRRSSSDVVGGSSKQTAAGGGVAVDADDDHDDDANMRQNSNSSSMYYAHTSSNSQGNTSGTPTSGSAANSTGRWNVDWDAFLRHEPTRGQRAQQAIRKARSTEDDIMRSQSNTSLSGRGIGIGTTNRRGRGIQHRNSYDSLSDTSDATGPAGAIEVGGGFRSNSREHTPRHSRGGGANNVDPTVSPTAVDTAARVRQSVNLKSASCDALGEIENSIAVGGGNNGNKRHQSIANSANSSNDSSVGESSAVGITVEDALPIMNKKRLNRLRVKMSILNTTSALTSSNTSSGGAAATSIGTAAKQTKNVEVDLGQVPRVTSLSLTNPSLDQHAKFDDSNDDKNSSSNNNNRNNNSNNGSNLISTPQGNPSDVSELSDLGDAHDASNEAE